MIFFIILLLLAIILSMGVLSYRSWEIRSGNEIVAHTIGNPLSKTSLKNFEKNALHFLKYCVQKVLLVGAKYWFTIRIRTKKFLMEKWPKVYRIFEKKPIEMIAPQKPSFFTKALLESKVKIKRLKKKIHEDHDMELGE